MAMLQRNPLALLALGIRAGRLTPGGALLIIVDDLHSKSAARRPAGEMVVTVSEPPAATRLSRLQRDVSGNVPPDAAPAAPDAGPISEPDRIFRQYEGYWVD